jgi:RHS repeat-associated protein
LTATGVPLSYTWDVAAGLPVVLQDSDGNSHVYGLDLISATDGAGDQTYFLCDGLGSTTELADADGDGCTAAEEQAMGYDDGDPYDFYDVPVPSLKAGAGTRNGAINITDVLAVLDYSGASEGGPDYEADRNGNGIRDGVEYDRSPSPPPNPPYDAGPPDTAISMADVMAANAQAGLECSGRLAQYVYDGQGNLVKRTMGDGSWTVYIGGIYEERQDESYVKYYSAFGRRIAMRDNAGMVHYILSDHLGSSTVVTDASGGEVGTMKYYPYGAERSTTGQMVTDKLFTGQQKEPQAISMLGLYNYGARFYSTLVGRFVSPDPLIASPGDPQTLNRYAYVRNNPLVYVDPSGLLAAFVCGAGMNCGTPNIEGMDFEAMDPDAIEEFQEWAISYWMWYEGLTHEEALARWEALMQDVQARGADPLAVLTTYGILFITTEKEGPPTGLGSPLLGEYLDALRQFLPLYVEHVESMLGVAAKWDVVVAYSLGGLVTALSMAGGPEWRAGSVVFVEPFFNMIGGQPNFEAADYGNMRILTLNSPGKYGGFFDPGGTVRGAINITAAVCDPHCTMQALAGTAMALAYTLPPGANAGTDAACVRFLRHFGMNACIPGGEPDVAC